MIKFPLEMNFIEVDGSDSVRNVTIKMSDPVDADRRHSERYSYHCNFSLSIPDHIWTFLAGRTVPSRGPGDRYPMKYGKTVKDFSKTLTYSTLDMLCSAWNDLLQSYKWLRDIDSAGLQRVIFYGFETAFEDYNDEYANKVRFGYGSKIKFLYSPGYRTTAGCYSTKHEPNKDLRYNSEMVAISQYSDRRLYEMKFVNWTQEREDFFAQLHSDFGAVIDRINNFERSISEKGLNRLIKSNMKFLEAGNDKN